NFDLDALRPIADRVGPTPTDLGQDPSLRTDPAEVANARWWKQEYGITG
ncbi:MAG: Amidohydrolase, partial [Acidimicrobiales bacterium]|nr:Amidohydrolase [Acidimicrobiales bacterium]